MFLDENGVPFMEEPIFQKCKTWFTIFFREVLQKVSEAYKDQRENIIKQKKLITNSLNLKKNPVLSQELEPIIELSMNNLDLLKGGYKGAQNFLHLIYMKRSFTFIINLEIKSI